MLNKKIITAIIGSFILLLIGFLVKETYFEKEKKIRPKTNKLASFKIISPTLKKDKTTLTYYNDIEPYAKLNIYSKEEGYIKKLFKDVSDRVKKGNIITEIDATEILEEEKEKKAALNSANSELIKNKIETKHKKLIFDRTKEAYSEKLIPIQELDNAKYDYQTSKANQKLIHGKIEEANASLKKIKIKLKYTKVISPINGIISKRLVEEGSLVKKNELLFEILKVNKLKLRLHIPEYEINKVFDKNFKIKKDINFSLYIPAIEKAINANLKTIYPIIDPKTKTVNIELVINNTGNIKPGLSATITLENKGINKIFIPQKASFYDEINDEYFVQIIKNNKAYKTKIAIEKKEGNKKELIVKQGININTKLILPFTERLKDGENVQKQF